MPLLLQVCSNIDHNIPTGRHIYSVIHVVCDPHVDLDLLFSLLIIRLELSFRASFSCTHLLTVLQVYLVSLLLLFARVV